MGPRPTHLRINSGRDDDDDDDDTDFVIDTSGSLQQKPPRMAFHMNLPSPRTGDIPPALSPLDMFAMQSRMLSKQFEQERNGRRISRLPPLAVQKELSARPDYFRKLSASTEGGTSDLGQVYEEPSPRSPEQHIGLAVKETPDKDRPISLYPTLGDAQTNSTSGPQPTQEVESAAEPTHSYFDMPRRTSPEPVDPALNVEGPSPTMPSLTNSVDSVQSSQPRSLTNGSTHSQRSLRSDRGLLPPRSPALSKTQRSMQSIRSVPQDSGDEDGSSYHGAYAASSSRKFSSGSTMSRPHSPFSPVMPSFFRSSSMASDASTGAPKPSDLYSLPRRPWNFSRPRSSSGHSIPSRRSFESHNSPETSFEVLNRNISAASNSTQPSTAWSSIPSRQSSQNDIRPPHPLQRVRSSEGEETTSDEIPRTSSDGANMLPRGRAVDRTSVGLVESWSQHQFSWERNASEVEPPAPSPRTMNPRDASASSASSLPAPRYPSQCPPSPANSERISGARLSRRLSRRDLSVPTPTLRSHSANPDTRRERSPLHRATPSGSTESTDRTIRATPLHQKSPSAELTPDEHLEIGIQAHSAGQLQKSTYHLRLAANAGLPTGMLLYALACRHGWGMRPNPEDGVKWLRRAIDSIDIHNLDVEATLSHATARIPNPDPVAERAERKKRKAQFALAIYELGISYMNGWGCVKDKALALRCYEVAGAWGDGDALAEAGFCYTQGIGCKKDLKRAAGFYRKAAEKGMSMAGNSWIYKPKYMDDDHSSRTASPIPPPPALLTERRDSSPASALGKEKSGQTRPRGRSLWGGRKKERS